LGLLVPAATAPHGWLGRWPLPGVGWIAAISYSLYLSHKIAMHVVHVELEPLMQVHGLPLFAIYAVAVLLLGAALHYLVERPSLRWRDRRAAATPARAAAPAAV
jgi:peptidoglycan/LPS O-acetylase OafA/YrhL